MSPTQKDERPTPKGRRSVSRDGRAASQGKHSTSTSGRPTDDVQRGISIRARLALGFVAVAAIGFIPAFIALRALGEDALRDTVTFIIIAAVLLVLLITLLPRQLLRPIAKLTATLRQAEAGNLNVSSPRSRIPELDALAVSLNRTLGRLRQFDKLKSRRVREEQRLRSALLAASDVGLAVLNPEGCVADANRTFREITGCSKETITGRRIQELLGEEIVPEFRKVQEERARRTVRCRVVTVGDATVSGEDSSATVSGSTPHVYARMSAVKDEVEGPPRVILRLTPVEESEGGAATS